MSHTASAQLDDATPAKQAKAGLIRDARGKKVTQLDPVEMRLLRRGEIDRAVLNAMADEIGSGLDGRTRKFVRIFIAGACVVLIILVIQIVDAVLSRDLGLLFSGRNVALFNIWFWPFMVWRVSRQKRFGKIRNVMLKHRHCPHCGYALTGLPADPTDDATVCPECGCAWVMQDEPLDDLPDTSIGGA